jgi:hypothetical protein
MGEKEKSGQPAGKVRICKLKADGKIEEIDIRELNPIVYCNKCRAKADDPSYLCNPRALKAPKMQKG